MKVRINNNSSKSEANGYEEYVKEGLKKNLFELLDAVIEDLVTTEKYPIELILCVENNTTKLITRVVPESLKRSHIPSYDKKVIQNKSNSGAQKNKMRKKNLSYFKYQLFLEGEAKKYLNERKDQLIEKYTLKKDEEINPESEFVKTVKSQTNDYNDFSGNVDITNSNSTFRDRLKFKNTDEYFKYQGILAATTGKTPEEALRKINKLLKSSTIDADTRAIAEGRKNVLQQSNNEQPNNEDR